MGLRSWFRRLLFTPDGRVASIYDIQMNSLDGTPISFDRYRGKTLMIVNTASKCGYTYQYAGLQKLHKQYGGRILILGFPANDFLWQEPGTNSDIALFCERNYGVTFQMFEKISVKGRKKHPLYQWLQAQTGQLPTWNFCKYIVDATGKIIAFFGPKVDPEDPQIVNLIP